MDGPKVKLIECLSDARKSFITPVMKKSVKPLVDSLSSGQCLYGDKLAYQIKEAKTIDNACQSIKAADKNTRKPLRRSQGNCKSSFAQLRQTVPEEPIFPL